MEYMTVKEMAKKWEVSIRTVNMYLNEGRVQGAIRKEQGWLIPSDAQKPVDRRRRALAEAAARHRKLFMPIFSLRYAQVSFEEAAAQIQDAEERAMAWAGHFYFQGELEQARDRAQEGFESHSAEIRLTARWIHSMAALGCGDAATCRSDFASILREGAAAQDEAVRVESEFITAVSGIYFHRDEADMTGLLPQFAHLPIGARYFALYARAHALYLRREYRQAVGEVEAALALMQNAYPVAAIYLNIVGAMACNSIFRHGDAQRFFDAAWEIAQRESYFEPFAEHHGMLQGLVEKKVRGKEPQRYEQISGLVYRFSRGWMKIHNPDSKLKVTDALTPYEFSIAMLAAKGRSNKEIAEYMSISVNSVKAYLTAIYQKVGVTKRSELKDYVNY